MAKIEVKHIDEQQLPAESPLDDLVYRALVFSKLNQHQQYLYFVAGVAGGPWSAHNALTHSHKAHGGPCFYCKKQVAKGEATIDHVEPTSRGGQKVIQNLVIACKPCNAAKGHQVIEFYKPDAGKEWLEALLRQIQQRLDRKS